jgi:hypothetical protein
MVNVNIPDRRDGRRSGLGNYSDRYRLTANVIDLLLTRPLA